VAAAVLGSVAARSAEDRGLTSLHVKPGKTVVLTNPPKKQVELSTDGGHQLVINCNDFSGDFTLKIKSKDGTKTFTEKDLMVMVFTGGKTATMTFTYKEAPHVFCKVSSTVALDVAREVRALDSVHVAPGKTVVLKNPPTKTVELSTDAGNQLVINCNDFSGDFTLQIKSKAGTETFTQEDLMVTVLTGADTATMTFTYEKAPHIFCKVSTMAAF